MKNFFKAACVGLVATLAADRALGSDFAPTIAKVVGPLGALFDFGEYYISESQIGGDYYYQIDLLNELIGVRRVLVSRSIDRINPGSVMPSEKVILELDLSLGSHQEIHFSEIVNGVEVFGYFIWDDRGFPNLGATARLTKLRNTIKEFAICASAGYDVRCVPLDIEAAQ